MKSFVSVSYRSPVLVLLSFTSGKQKKARERERKTVKGVRSFIEYPEREAPRLDVLRGVS